MTGDRVESAGQALWDKHATAVGKIAMAWNAFQEALVEIFLCLFERADWNVAVASWHALTSDACQQEMLRAAARVRYGAESTAYREINWMLEQTKQQLSHQRNFGIHTPFMILHEKDSSVHVLPHSFTGNRRAEALLLSGKDVLEEAFFCPVPREERARSMA